MTSIIIPGPEGDDNANLIIRSTSHLGLPSGDDSTRTVTGYSNEPGNIRFNTSSQLVEYYKSVTTGWHSILSINGSFTVNDQNKLLKLNNNQELEFTNITTDNITDIDKSNSIENDILVLKSGVFVTRRVDGELQTSIDNSNVYYTIKPNVISSKTALTSVDPSDEFLVYDTSATSLKKVTKSNLLSGYLTSVPTATTTTLGIVKPDGSTISIDANGTLSVGGSGGGGLVVADGVTIINNGGTISAATATSSTNGILRPDNSTITISNGVISAVAVSGLESRNNIVQSIPAGTNNINFTNGYKSYLLLKIQTSDAAWVTLYTDNTSRTNDSGRSQGTDPTPGSGVIAEVVTTGNQTVLITPGTFGFNNDSTPGNTIYAKVVNVNAITLSLTIVKLEN